MKNRNRSPYSFANVNLMGRCNYDCFYCLGKDLKREIKGLNHLDVHFTQWKNFQLFLDNCLELNIHKIYITGQNTDPLLYNDLHALIDYLQEEWPFTVGLRTNGLLAHKFIPTINTCKDEIGFTMQSLRPGVNEKITGTREMPDWIPVLKQITSPTRMSIVLNRYNRDELFTMLYEVSQMPNIRYIQIRRVATDTRQSVHQLDQRVFDEAKEDFLANCVHVSDIEGAPIFKVFGMDVVFWETVATTANSINYFTDGTISDEYFIVEGYKKYSALKETK